MADVIEFEEGIKAIAEQADTTQKEVFNEVQRQKEHFKGLLSEESAVIYTGKAVYGIDLINEVSEANISLVEVADIEAGDHPVNCELKVEHIGDTFEFTTSNGNEGRGREVKLYDDTGSIPLMLWWDDCDEADAWQRGDIIRIKGAEADRYKGTLQLKLPKKYWDIEVIEESPARQRQKDAAEAFSPSEEPDNLVLR